MRSLRSWLPASSARMPSTACVRYPPSRPRGRAHIRPAAPPPARSRWPRGRRTGQAPRSPALGKNLGEAPAYRGEGVLDRPAQLLVGHHVRVHREPPDRTAAQRRPLAAHVPGDPFGDASRPGQVGVHPAGQVSRVPPDGGQGQVLLAAEVVIHGPLPGTGPFLDRLGAGAHVPAFPEQFPGALDEPLPRIHTLTVHTSRYSRQAWIGPAHGSRGTASWASRRYPGAVSKTKRPAPPAVCRRYQGRPLLPVPGPACQPP